VRKRDCRYSGEASNQRVARARCGMRASRRWGGHSLVALMSVASDLSAAPSQVTGLLRRSLWPLVAVGIDLAFRLVAAILQW